MRNYNVKPVTHGKLAALFFQCFILLRSTRIDERIESEMGHSLETLGGPNVRAFLFSEKQSDSLAYTIGFASKGPLICALSRQNASIRLDQLPEDPRYCAKVLSGNSLHKEYSLPSSHGAATSAESIYLASSDMCGASLFSRPQLNCDAVSFEALQLGRALLQDLPPTRAFGVELEMVAKMDARNHGPDMVRLAKTLALDRSKQSLHSELVTPPVTKCFGKKVDPVGLQTCTSHDDCPPNAYCRKAHKTFFTTFPSPYCKHRGKCLPDKSVDGVCPRAMNDWTLTHDPSEKPLTLSRANMDGAAKPEEEIFGVPFELVSPILSGAEGLESMNDVITSLKNMGVQAGPSAGMHVHINVGKPWKGQASPGMGEHLSARQIFNVFAHYARFQLVINEMLQDSRVGNSYSHPLLLSLHSTFDPSVHTIDREAIPLEDFEETRAWPRNMVRRLYANLKNMARKNEERDAQYCTSIMPSEWRNSCQERYPEIRYFQVNLVPLDRFGTIEFRAFPATSDPERSLRWVLFLLRFVDHYKDDARFLDIDSDGLAEMQLESSLEELEQELNTKLDYYRTRPWISGKACEMEGDDDEDNWVWMDMQRERAEAAAVQKDWSNGQNLPRPFDEQLQINGTAEDAIDWKLSPNPNGWDRV